MSYTQYDINRAGQIALNALSAGFPPTDTAGMDSDDEEWYLSKGEDGDGSIDDLILHLYKLLKNQKNQKKKGSQKKKRSKKKKKRSKKKRSRTRKRKGK